MTCLIITIDGGAASGKSSTSRALAEALNLLHVDTGSHYRSLTHALLDKGCDPDDSGVVAREIAGLHLGVALTGRQARLVVDGKVFTDEEIRSERVNRSVSRFASLPVVREKLLAYQRMHPDVAGEQGYQGLVMEGRDIGSVVFPEAPFRFYLEADPATRQKRRAEEGQVDSIRERDRLDSSRSHAPLRMPDGAIRIDTAAMSLEEVVACILKQVHHSQP
jgi:CMP/dCMP kinase